MNKRELLDRFSRDSEQRVLLARLLDQKERAEQKKIPTHTGFFSPAQQADAADLLAACIPGRGVLFGGYEDAQRKLWAFLPDWLEEEDWRSGEDCPVCALSVRVPRGAELTHRDYLGSLMGLGISREKIGDILPVAGGAQVLVLRETLSILLTQWDKAGRYPVTLEPLPLDELRPEKGETKKIRDTAASLRLDAVLSAGFSLARSRAGALIREGRVSVNGRPCDKADRAVAEGDVFTCRGLGKCVLTKVGGISKRGRIILELERYL